MGEQDRRLDQELRDLLTPLGVVSTPVGEESIQLFTLRSLYDKRDRQLWVLFVPTSSAAHGTLFGASRLAKVQERLPGLLVVHL